MRTASDIIVRYEDLKMKIESVSHALDHAGRDIDRATLKDLKKDGRYSVQLLVSEYERLTKQVEGLKGTMIKVVGHLENEITDTATLKDINTSVENIVPTVGDRYIYGKEELLITAYVANAWRNFIRAPK